MKTRGHRTTARIEAALLAGAVALVLVLTAAFDEFGLEAWARRSSAYSALRDQLFTGVVALALAASLFAWRRWHELRREIVGRQRAEAELRASEAHLRAVFESAPIGMATVDAEGRLLRTNRAFQEMLGYAGDDLRDRNPGDFSSADDDAEPLHLFNELVAGQRERYQVEKRYYHQDGRLIWVSWLFIHPGSPGTTPQVLASS